MSKENDEFCRSLFKFKREFDETVEPDYGHMGMVFFDESDMDEHVLENGSKVRQIKTENILGDYVYFDGNPSDKICIYIHGGGFLGGTAKDVRHVTQYVAKNLNYNVISLTYPLAPENPFPDAVNFCAKAYVEVVKKYGGENVIVMGESAGGNLVFASVLRAKELGAPLPKGLFSFSPVAQFEKLLPSAIQNDKTDCIVSKTITRESQISYLSNKKENFSNPLASIKNADFKGFPKTYISVSDSEVLFEDSVLLQNRLLECGVDSTLRIYPRMVHAFPFHIHLPEAIEVFDEVKEILKTL